MKQATLVWEWENAPQHMRTLSPAYDDVSYLVVLPEGETVIPYWVETLVSPGGFACGGEWKRVIQTGELAGRVLVAICHA